MFIGQRHETGDPLARQVEKAKKAVFFSYDLFWLCRKNASYTVAEERQSHKEEAALLTPAFLLCAPANPAVSSTAKTCVSYQLRDDETICSHLMRYAPALFSSHREWYICSVPCALICTILRVHGTFTHFPHYFQRYHTNSSLPAHSSSLPNVYALFASLCILAPMERRSLSQSHVSTCSFPSRLE